MPFLIPGTTLFRSNVNARPIWSTLPGVIWVSGEWRIWSTVLPKLNQFVVPGVAPCRASAPAPPRTTNTAARRAPRTTNVCRRIICSRHLTSRFPGGERCAPSDTTLQLPKRLTSQRKYSALQPVASARVPQRVLPCSRTRRAGSSLTAGSDAGPRLGALLPLLARREVGEGRERRGDVVRDRGHRLNPEIGAGEPVVGPVPVGERGLEP